MRTFVNQFSAAYNAISKKQFLNPENTKSLILVQKALISNIFERLVIHNIDFTKNDCYDEVSKSLIRIMGDKEGELWHGGRSVRHREGRRRSVRGEGRNKRQVE